MVFDLADGQTMPSTWKEGDEVDVALRPEHPAMLAVGINKGFYEVRHIPSGEKIKVMHDTSKWRFQ